MGLARRDIVLGTNICVPRVSGKGDIEINGHVIVVISDVPVPATRANKGHESDGNRIKSIEENERTCDFTRSDCKIQIFIAVLTQEKYYLIMLFCQILTMVKRFLITFANHRQKGSSFVP